MIPHATIQAETHRQVIDIICEGGEGCCNEGGEEGFETIYETGGEIEGNEETVCESIREANSEEGSEEIDCEGDAQAGNKILEGTSSVEEDREAIGSQDAEDRNLGSVQVA